MNVALTTGTKLGPYEIIDLTQASSVLFLLMMTVLVFIGILLYALIIKFILKQPEPRRAVDWMLLVDQLIQGISYSVMAIMILIMLWMNKSIKDIFGHGGCLIIFVLTPIYMWERLVGGLGLSLFRYLFMEKSQLIQDHGVNKIIKYIWSFEALVVTLPLVTATWNLISGRGVASATVCRGIPIELYELETTFEHDSDDNDFVSSLMNSMWKSFTMARVSLVIIELALNIKLYIGYAEQIKRMKASLSAKTVTKRTKKSAISLEGHLVGFFINFFFDVIISVVVVFNAKLGLEGYNVYNIGMIVTAISNLGTLLASPELRREYLGDDDILCPKRRAGQTSPEEAIEMANMNETNVDQDEAIEEILTRMSRSPVRQRRATIENHDS